MATRAQEIQKLALECLEHGLVWLVGDLGRGAISKVIIEMNQPGLVRDWLAYVFENFREDFIYQSLRVREAELLNVLPDVIEC